MTDSVPICIFVFNTGLLYCLGEVCWVIVILIHEAVTNPILSRQCCIIQI